MDEANQLRQQILALQQRNGELEARLVQASQTQPFDDLMLRRVHEQLEQRFDQTLAERRLFIELIDHSLANVFVIAPDLRLQAINRTARETFKRLHGFCPRVGERVDEVLAGLPSMLERLRSLLRRALTGQTVVENVSFDGPPYRRHYELRVSPLRSDGAPPHSVYLFAYDITERTLEQEHLREVEQALRQAQKMEAVGQLTGGIAHDFNNLLGGIFGALELAGQRLIEPSDQEARRLLGIIEQNASKAASLVQRLLAFSRRQTLLPRVTDIRQLTAEMLPLIERSLRDDIELIDRTADDLWPACIDASQLENTLLNLCLNARDAMPDGGSIVIHCQNLQMDEQQAQYLRLPAGQYLHLRVEDQGIGMSETVAQRATEPFYTTKPMGQGSGLGLSMAYGFVRQSGGQLHLESSLGQGTCVHLYLPRAQIARQDAPTLPAQATPPAAPTILLLEEQAAMRLVLSELLSDAGYQVHSLEHIDQALALIHSGTVATMLLANVTLNDTAQGRQLIEACQASCPDCVLLFMASYGAASSHAPQALPDSAQVLASPVELDALLAQVGRAMG